MLLRAFLARHKSLLGLLLVMGIMVGTLEGSFILLAKWTLAKQALSTASMAGVAITSGSIPSLGWVGLLLMMSFIVTARTAVQIVAARIELGAVFAFLAENRRALLQTLSERAVPVYRSPWRESLASALDDGQENLGQGIAAGFRCLAAAAQALVLLPMLFLFSWKLAAAALALAVPAISVSRLRAGMLGAAGRGWERSKSDLAAEAEGFADSSEAHIGNGRIAYAASAMENGLERHASHAHAWETAKAIFPPALEWFFFLALAALAGLAAAHGGGGSATGPAGLIPFGALLLLIYRPIREWARNYPASLLGGQAWRTLGNLNDTLGAFPARAPFPAASGSEIRLERIGFSYSQDRSGNNRVRKPAVPPRKVFEDLDLELDPAALTWITGPNGDGKSTLLKLLAGVETAQAGHILVPMALGTGVHPFGYLPQKAVVEPDWMAWSRIYRSEQAEAWSALDGILGLEAILEKNPKGLSGGERQRLCLARAFASPGGYLLLDEPTTWLSAEDRERIVGDLLAFWRDPRNGKATRGAAIVSHEPFLGEFCSRTVRLRRFDSVPIGVPAGRSSGKAGAGG